jgi:hypothetical protein
LLAGIPYVLLFLAFVLPFRLGLLGRRFRSALLIGWGLYILALWTWDITNPSGDPWSRPSQPLVTRIIILVFGAMTGWLPASSVYPVGRLARRSFKLQATNMGWGRFTVVVALLIVVLWWPGVRVFYFVRMSEFNLSARQRDSDFSRLARVLPPPDATLVKVYRGLPHQMYDTGALWRDLFLTSNRAIAGYRFRTPPAEVSAELGGGLSRAMQNRGLYHPYFGAKLCGGYHPDYCFEWESPKGSFFALLCLGCREMRLVGNGATVHCDMHRTQVLELEDLVKRLKDE